MRFDDLSNRVIGFALEVHKQLGPGLLESAYKQCLAYELGHSGINFEIEKEIPVRYKRINMDCGYRIDLLVENKLIIELKSVERLLPIHDAQILTYMKLTKIEVGLLINFNQVLLRHGIKRFVL